MIDIIDLQEAKDHVRIVTSQFDSDISLKILQASAIMLNYLKIDLDGSPLEFPWSGDDVPWDVKAATMLVFGDLWKNRESDVASPLSQAVKDLVRRWRDPAMA